MGILDLLKADHDKIKELYLKLNQLSSGQSDQRKELFAELKQQIVAHAHAEEDVFYTHIQKSLEDQGFIDNCYTEHEEVEDFLDDIDDQIAAENDWMTTLSSMMAALNSHIESEEGSLFVKARSMLTKEEQEQLGREFDEAKQTA